MTEPDRSISNDPNVTQALDDGRSPDDIYLLRCLNCAGFSYYNEGSHWTCRFCDETLTANEIDDIDILTLSDYLEMVDNEGYLP